MVSPSHFSNELEPLGISHDGAFNYFLTRSSAYMGQGADDDDMQLRSAQERRGSDGF
jgi:hypothetical protein